MRLSTRNIKQSSTPTARIMPITKTSSGSKILTKLVSADKGGASFESVLYTEGGASFESVTYTVGLENSTVNKLCITVSYWIPVQLLYHKIMVIVLEKTATIKGASNRRSFTAHFALKLATVKHCK